MSKLMIGWAETDTTPEGAIDLFGQYYHRVSDGIHSRLSATALAFESDAGDQAVMVSLDIACFQADFLKELRAALCSKLPEVAASSIILNAIHTHNAPGVDDITGIGWLSELPGVMTTADYRNFLLGKLVDTVGEAWRNRRPGGIAGTLGFARVGHCRRALYSNGTAEMYGQTDRDDFIGMEGGEDSGVDLLFTYDDKRNPTGVILNLACPSQVMEATYQISSDFIGETRRLLKERYGVGFRTLGQISAAGCQSPRDLTRGYKGEPDFWRADGVAEIGRRLLRTVEEARPTETAKIEFAPVFRHVVHTFSLPRRRASYQDYLDAKKKLVELEAILPEDKAYRQFCEEVRRNEKVSGRPGPYDSKLHHFVLIQNNKAVVARYETQDAQPVFDAEVHVLRLGEAVVATNPFELYLDFGQRIKARSVAEQTFVVQLCGDTGGYLPSERAEQFGGYGGLIINGIVGSAGGTMLVDETVGIIAGLWK